MNSFESQRCVISVTKLRASVPRKKYAWLVVERNEGDRLANQLHRMCKYNSVVDIIVVDGDSTDGTIGKLLEGKIGISDLVISKAKAGFSTDLQIGLIYAAQLGYSGVITSDGNGKDSVDDVQKFVKLLDDGADLIQGSRFLERGNHTNTPFLRYLGIRFVSSPFTSLTAKIKITDSTNGFRGYSQRLISHEKLKLDRRVFRGYSLVSFIPFFVGKNKMKFAEVSVRRDYPASGVTPTKIVSLSQWVQIFLDLFRATFETYRDRDCNEWLVFSED